MLTFLHGFLGSPSDWDPILKEIDLPHTCLLLPGHLGSPFDLEAFEKKIPDQTTLVGYSLGGRLAMQYAHKFPKKVTGLILLSVNPGLETGIQERLLQDERWATLLEEKGIDHFLKEWYRQPLFSSLELDEALLKRRRGHDPKGLAAVLSELSPAKLPNLWPYLKKFPLQTTFLFGQNDSKYRPIGERLNRNFAVKWLPGCGHAVHLEAPSICAKYIK